MDVDPVSGGFPSSSSPAFSEFSADSDAAAEGQEGHHHHHHLVPHQPPPVSHDQADQQDAAAGSDAESCCCDFASGSPPNPADHTEDLQDDVDEAEGGVPEWAVRIFALVRRTHASDDDDMDDDHGDEVATSRRSTEDRREEDRLFWEACLRYGYSANS